MSQASLRSVNGVERRSFVGGSDARVIMGADEAALLRLWREKRGEAEPEDLSGNLIVQLGLVTEALNRHWYERNTGQVIECVQHRLRHPVLRWMGATLDGIVANARPRSTWRRSSKDDLDQFDAVVDYFRLGCRGFRSRRPSPSPLVNSIPTRWRAICIAFKAPSETIRLSFSKSTTVERPSPAARASCDWVISRRARAARHWPGLIVSTIFIDISSAARYQ